MSEDAANLYAKVVRFVEQHGWQRMEPGEGWWWHHDPDGEETLGLAFEAVLDAEGIDTREEPA